MNLFRTIVKAAKAVVRTVKELFQMVKASFEVKRAKAKAWHEYKRFSNPQYIPAIVAIVTGLVRIFIPVHIISTMVRVILEGWGEMGY